ncbi:MAG: LysE family translocator [Fluviicola sp.]|nr:LysE family translocator [Fluviicola sp.]
MLDLVLKGIVTGFILSIMIGPVFFILLETSIRKGVRSALAFDLGVLLSDLIYIIIAYVFYAQVAKLTSGDKSYIFQLVGGFIFIIFGVVTLMKKPKPETGNEAEMVNQTRDYLMLGLKGFLLNFANPAVIFYWLTVIAFGIKQTDSSNMDQNVLIYVAIIIMTFFSVDILKIVGAKKLRPFITDKVLMGLNRLTGIIIVCAGLYMIFNGIRAWYEL